MWLQSHNGAPTIVLRMEQVMEASGTLLGSISDFCRRTGMAESTFGRRAVNDGKFVARLRDGARVDRKSTRLNSSHGYISYAVFCLKKKKKNHKTRQIYQM